MVDTLKSRWEVLDSACDPRAVFALTYLAITRSAAQYIADEYFDDGNSMANFITKFAGRYIAAFDAWNTDETTVSKPWQQAFSNAASGNSNATEDLLLGMNAHINYDLAIATYEAGYYALNRKADYDRLNDGLKEIIYNVSVELGYRYGPAMSPSVLKGIAQSASVIIGWRANAWNNAVLFNLAPTDAMRNTFIKGTENQAALGASLLESSKSISIAEATAPNMKEASKCEAFPAHKVSGSVKTTFTLYAASI